MQKNILQRLSQNYFQGIADDISNAKIISAVYSNTNDVGDVRENVLQKFLESHLPQRCSVVKGGTVFDSLGNESKQIDLLVTNDISLRFSYFDRDYNRNKNIQTIEGCLAAISIKSTLKDKDSLTDVLSNLASIPAMPENIWEQINPSIPNREEYVMFPKKIVFAYSSDISVETTLKHINEYYVEQRLNEYQKADLIVVNKCFSIIKIGKRRGTTRGGTLLEEGVYHPVSKKELVSKNNLDAYFLINLINTIHSTTNWSPHLFLDYQKYVNAMEF